MSEPLSKIRKIFCHHKWTTYNVFIYNPDLQPRENIDEFRKDWFYEVKEYMESIGLEGVWPVFFQECKKCEKQTVPSIDTLIKATVVDWYKPPYYDGQNIDGNYPVVENRE